MGFSRRGHWAGMRGPLLVLLGLSLACGRSDLLDDLPPSFTPDEAGPSADGTSLEAGDDATTPGIDVSPPPLACGLETCPTGCCNDGFCMDPPTAQSGGAQGAPCLICPPDTFCAGLRGCVSNGDTCHPGDCTGCCYGDVCAQGRQTIACGVNGNSCVTCGTGSQVCSGGQGVKWGR